MIKTTRIFVLAIVATAMLTVSGPSFAAKRTLQNSHMTSAVKSQPRAGELPYGRDDPYAPGVNWPKGA